MLVEQITGHQRLEDGASYETTLTITPTTVVDLGEAGDDCHTASPDGVFESPAPAEPADPMAIPATPAPDPVGEPMTPAGAQPTT